MYLQEQRIYYYAELLGEDRPDVKLKLETYKRFPEIAGRIESELLAMLRWEGCDITDLPVFPSPSPEDLNGSGLYIGHFIEKGSKGRAFNVPSEVFDGYHSMVEGQPGTGKSILCKILFCELTNMGIPVLHLDYENEASDLVKILGHEKALLVNPIDLKIPLLQPPPNCRPEDFYGDVKNNIREILYVREGVLNSLDKLKDYCAEKGNPLPTVTDFFNLTRNWKTTPVSRERGFFETLENRFRFLVNSPFDGREAHPLEKLLETSAIIQTGNITDNQFLLFFINHLLSWFMRYREHNPHNGPSNVVILEECHKFLYRKAEDRADLGEPKIIQLARQSRKRGFSFVYVDQSPRHLSPQIRANVSNSFASRLSDPRDIRAVGYPMGLDDGKMEVFPTLKQREEVIKIHTHRNAYLVEIKPFESVDPSKEELQEFRKVSLEKLTPLRFMQEPVRTRIRDPGKETPTLTLWRDYLMHVIKNPSTNRNMRKNDLGLSQWELTKLTDDLKRRGFIKEHKISFGKKGTPGTYDEILKPGFDYLCMKYEPLRGKGNFAHRLIQYIVSEKVNGSIEFRGADVGWEKPNGEKIAIEIEMNPDEKENILKNVSRDLGTGFSEVWIVCRNESEREKIRYILDTWLDGEDRDKLQVKLIREIV